MKLKKLVSGNSVQTVIGVTGGGIAANLVNNVVTKAAEKMSPGIKKFAPAAPIILGLILSGQKNKLLANAGLGMISVGGMKLAGSLVPALAGVCGLSDNAIEGIYDEVLTLDGLTRDAEHLAGDPLAGDESLGGDEDLG